MTDTDKLARVIAGHGVGRLENGRVRCVCGALLIDRARGDRMAPSEAYRTHLAAVVLAHITAEGWAQGREEWATAILPDVIYPARSYFHAESDASYFGRQLVRRRVTEWEEA